MKLVIASCCVISTAAWLSMGTRSSTPDLFSLPSNQSTTATSANRTSTLVDKPAVPASTSRYALPTNLPHALKQLADNDPDRLLSAVIAEQNRRGKKLAVSHEISRKRQIQSLAVPLTQGKLVILRNGCKSDNGIRD